MGESMKAQTEAELIRLTGVLGGGWGWDQGVMPYIKLTMPEAVAAAAKIPQEGTFENVEEELRYNLTMGEQYARRAHDLLYKPEGPKRSMLFRMLVGRAQSILMSLYVQELRRKT